MERTKFQLQNSEWECDSKIMEIIEVYIYGKQQDINRSHDDT